MAGVWPYLWMILGSLAFASMGALAHRLRASCDWQVIVLARVGLQLLLALLLAWIAGVALVLWRPWTLWVRSVAGSLGIVCTFYAYTRLPVAEALTLNTLFPVWVALLSWPLLHQPPSLAVWLAVASGIVGVVLMQQPRFAEGNLAALVALASSVFTGVAMIALNRLQGIDPRAIIVHFSAVSVAVALGSYFTFAATWAGPVLAAGGSRPPADGPVLVAVLLLGVGLMALVGQLFLTGAFTTGNATKVSVVHLSQVVFGMMFDVFFFGHELSWPKLLGMGLILGPTAWLMMEPARAARSVERLSPHGSPEAEAEIGLLGSEGRVNVARP